MKLLITGTNGQLGHALTAQAQLKAYRLQAPTI